MNLLDCFIIGVEEQEKMVSIVREWLQGCLGVQVKYSEKLNMLSASTNHMPSNLLLIQHEGCADCRQESITSFYGKGARRPAPDSR